MKKSTHMGTYAPASNDVEPGVAKRPERSYLKRIGLAGCAALSVPALLYSAMALAAYGNAYLTFDGDELSGYAETWAENDWDYVDEGSCQQYTDYYFECDYWQFSGVRVDFKLKDPWDVVRASAGESSFNWHTETWLPMTAPSVSGWWTGHSKHYSEWEQWRVFCFRWIPDLPFPQGWICELGYLADSPSILEDEVYDYQYVPPP